MDISAAQYLFGSFFLLANRLQTMGDAYLPEITMKQWLLLMMVRTLHDKEPCVSEVASYTGSSRQNVRKMLDSLAARGYVELRPGTRDKRNVSVHLTDHARRFFAAFETRGNSFLEQLFRGVSSDTLKTGQQLFETLFENVERMEEADSTPPV